MRKDWLGELPNVRDEKEDCDDPRSAGLADGDAWNRWDTAGAEGLALGADITGALGRAAGT